MSPTVTLVNQDEQAMKVKCSLFGPETDRVRMKSVCDDFRALEVMIVEKEGFSALEPDETGLSTYRFVAGDIYTVSVVPHGEFSLERTAKEFIRISDVGTEVWGNLRTLAKLKVEGPSPLEGSVRNDFPAFGWDNTGEKSQSDRYITHISSIRRGGKWSIIDTAKSHPELLSQNIHGLNFRGTTDVAFVDRQSVYFPEVGLKCIMELRKKIEPNSQFQTNVSLVLANVISLHLKPVAILTDLIDRWILQWLDGSSLFYHEFESRGHAVGYLEDFFRDENTLYSTTKTMQDDAPELLHGGIRKLSLLELKQLGYHEKN